MIGFSTLETNLTRRHLIRSGVALGLIAGLGSALRAAAPTPVNVLFLLADDLRADAVGYANPLVHTPHLDRLSQRSVRFRNAFVTTSICSTSRASIFTGTYARRHRIWDFETALSPELLRLSYPVLFRRAGYRTGFFGKYGVGDVRSIGGILTDAMPPRAELLGFDTMEDWGFNYFPPSGGGRHSNQVIVDRAEEFLRSTPVGRPFCLSLSFNAPHEAPEFGTYDSSSYVPLPAEADQLPQYAHDIFADGPYTGAESFATLPRFLQQSTPHSNWQRHLGTPAQRLDYSRRYFALTSGMDRAIGRILDCLEALNLRDDTLIVFASDNGFLLGDYQLHGKWYGYESSIRIPLLICPPGGTQPRNVEEPVLNIDIAPTILAACGIAIPSRMQGRSMVPFWSGGATRWRSDFLYEYLSMGAARGTAPDVAERALPSTEGVRGERYTYLRYPYQNGPNEALFDRQTDPGELRNIIDRAPRGVAQQLRRRTDQLVRWAA